MEKRFYETGFRLKKAEKDALRAKDLYVFERRDCGRETSIEPRVIVDFLGTLVTNFPIRFQEKGPRAYVIYDGDGYLAFKKAKCVYDVAELAA